MTLWIVVSCLMMLIFFPCATMVEVTLTPMGRSVVYPGSAHRYVCSSSDGGLTVIKNIQWFLNGSMFDDQVFENVRATLSTDGNEIASGRLTFTNLSLEYRMTQIQCRMQFQSESNVSSNTVTLIVQGTLSAVESLVATRQDSLVLVNWTAPPNFDEEITYCVAVVNVTSQRSLQDHECIAETQFTYPSNGCHEIEFTVTPVNGAGSGESRTVSYIGAESPPRLAELDGVGRIVTSAPVCDSTLTFTDVETEECITLQGTNLDTAITFTIKLQDNRHYRVSLTASNIFGQATSATTLSTYDIKNVTIAIEDNNVTAQPEYVEDSRARGALIIFALLDESGKPDIDSASYLALGRNMSLNYPLPVGFTSGRTAIFLLFDIESDGAVASGVGYPAVSRELEITEELAPDLPSQASKFYLQDCHAIANMSSILVDCGSIDSEVNGFQVVVHHQEEIEKLYVNRTSKGQTKASILVQEPGLYQVVVFAILEESGVVGSDMEILEPVIVDNTSPATQTTTVILKSSTGGLQMTIGVSIGVVAGILLVVVIILLIVILAFTYYRRRKSDGSSYPVRDEEDKCESTDFGGPTSPDVKDTGLIVPVYESIRPEQISPPIRSNGVREVSQELTEQHESQQPSPHPSPRVARQRHFEDSQESAPAIASRNEMQIDSTYAVITNNGEPADQAEVETHGESTVPCISTELYDEIRNPECAATAEEPALGHDAAMSAEQVQSASNSQQPSGDATIEMYAVVDLNKKKPHEAHENGASSPREDVNDVGTVESQASAEIAQQPLIAVQCHDQDISPPEDAQGHMYAVVVDKNRTQGAKMVNSINDNVTRSPQLKPKFHQEALSSESVQHIPEASENEEDMHETQFSNEESHNSATEDPQIVTDAVYAVVDKSKKTSKNKEKPHEERAPHTDHPYNNVVTSTSANPTFYEETTLPDVVPVRPVEESSHSQNTRPNQYDNVVALGLQEESNSGVMGVFQIRPPCTDNAVDSYSNEDVTSNTSSNNQSYSIEQHAALEAQWSPFTRGNGTTSFSPVQEEWNNSDIRLMPQPQATRGVEMGRSVAIGYQNKVIDMVTDL